MRMLTILMLTFLLDASLPPLPFVGIKHLSSNSCASNLNLAGEKSF